VVTVPDGLRTRRRSRCHRRSCQYGRDRRRHSTAGPKCRPPPDPETLRTLRESRKAACLTFAEVAERYLDLLSTTLLPVGRIERFPEQRENLIANAHNHWKRALRYRQNEVQRARGVGAAVVAGVASQMMGPFQAVAVSGTLS
jgi:hypothetical protein